mmetsp:Transcript_4615/g.7682  ORF Transcript_4615/g.7682 Transcript_4615/m.7682 type:complete len:221 (-) Transcript_4615:503-1165(-)
MMTAIKQFTRHVYTLCNLIEHPPVNVRVHSHDVVRCRELFLTVESRGKEWGSGHIVGCGEMIVLEVVIFVVDQCAFIYASRFKISVAQQSKVILRKLHPHNPLIRYAFEHGTLRHVRHDRLHALIDRRDRSVGRRRDFRVVATMSPRQVTSTNIPMHNHLFRRVHASVPKLLLLTIERIGRIGNIDVGRRFPAVKVTSIPTTKGPGATAIVATSPPRIGH